MLTALQWFHARTYMHLAGMDTMATFPLAALPTFAGVAIDTAEITEEQITLHAD